MFDKDDPRASLATISGRSPVATDHDGSIRPPQYIEFDQEESVETSAAGSPSWYFRGQNFTLSLTRLREGDTLARHEEDNEYLVLLTDNIARVTVAVGAETENIDEQALVVVPPGDSTVTARAETVVIRLFDRRATDLLAKARNAAAYESADPRVTALTPWPDPVGGPRLRVYCPGQVSREPGRFGRIFRTSAFMVNFLDVQDGPRDPERLSPHHHDDFEQCSLAVEGSFVHHIRTPWTTRSSQWQDDEHRQVGSPSIAIIPPPTIHTSEAVGNRQNRLIDIFCPPREDFSVKDGWVLNAMEYPQP